MSFAEETLGQATILIVTGIGPLIGLLFMGVDFTHPVIMMVSGMYLGGVAAGVYQASKYRVICGNPIEVERR